MSYSCLNSVVIQSETRRYQNDSNIIPLLPSILAVRALPQEARDLDSKPSSHLELFQSHPPLARGVLTTNLWARMRGSPSTHPEMDNQECKMHGTRREAFKRECSSTVAV